MRRPEFEFFLIRNRISRTRLSKKSTVDRSTLYRWVEGEVFPRGDSLDLVLDALSEILGYEVTAKEAGLE